MFPKLCPLVVLLFVAGVADAFPLPKKPEPLVTRTYDLNPVLSGQSRPADLADADAVIRLILETIRFRELKPGTDGPQLVERDGGKLEVRATAKVHDEVKDLLDALARLADVAVDVKADVIELDKAAADKLAKLLPKPARGKPASPVAVFGVAEENEDKGPTPAEAKALADANTLLKAGKVVQTSTARFVNGAEATFAARRSVVTFHPNEAVGKQPAGPPRFVKEGFKLVGVPVVSADRRAVRFRLTEQSAMIAPVRKREGNEFERAKRVAGWPELDDLGATGSAAVPDGGTVLFRLTYAPADKVWVVVLRPTIFVRAEEDERKKGEKK